ncbi:unnamed protein product [Ixodes persulcatus]
MPHHQRHRHNCKPSSEVRVTIKRASSANTFACVSAHSRKAHSKAACFQPRLPQHCTKLS